MTVTAENLAKLKHLFSETARTRKHSAYQLLADPVAELLGDVDVKIRHKNEVERLTYIKAKVGFLNCNVLDIGCNTGFFLFESLRAGATRAMGYEGSVEHAVFVQEAASLLNMENVLEVRPQYFDFESMPGRFDVALLLNVLHHVGDDYGDPSIGIDQARASILRQLNRMSRISGRLVFQLGFNWRGDPDRCLFLHGTKAEMIDFIREGTSGYWNIDAIGVAVRQGDEISYRDVNEQSIQRDDSLGEFLNRPIFIMSSLGAME